MVFVPAGAFDRGDHSGAGYRDERPVRTLNVSAFWIEPTEVTWGVWNEVFQWATNHGYTFGETYDFHPGRADARPVCNVSWHDAVKWTNARSEREGRTTVYRTNGSPAAAYRFGEVDLGAEDVLWGANGYRLPTEAEWERAARGGLKGQHYPWPSPGPDFAGFWHPAWVNAWESGDPWESDADCATTPVGYYDGQQQPAGPVVTNALGLFDVSGNVSEWCWDWYRDNWYEDPASGMPDTRGPSWGYGRVLRGGSWISSNHYCRLAARYMSAPNYRCHCYGLRCVVSAPNR